MPEISPLSDKVWVERCVASMVALDPELDPSLAEPIVTDMCNRSRWRAMEPEVAAQMLFDVGRKPVSPRLKWRDDCL